jgi:hypothetical protein
MAEEQGAGRRRKGTIGLDPPGLTFIELATLERRQRDLAQRAQADQQKAEARAQRAATSPHADLQATFRPRGRL